MHNCTYLLLGKCCLFRVNILFFVSKRAKVWFAHFLSELLTVALLLWATWANRSSCSFVKSSGSESLKLLFKKERMSEEQWERFALGHKKGKNCQKHSKNINFSRELLVLFFCERFAQITSKSLASLVCKEQCEWKSEFPALPRTKTLPPSCRLLSSICFDLFLLLGKRCRDCVPVQGPRPCHEAATSFHLQGWQEQLLSGL